MMRPLRWAAVAALLVGCAEAIEPPGPSPQTPEVPKQEDPGFKQEPGDEVPEFEHPNPVVPPDPRLLGRLTVQQLQRSIPVIAGTDLAGDPIEWTAIINGREVNAFAFGAYGKALGRTDNFGEITEPNLAVSPLYVKFADDMARQVCEKMAAADADKAPGDRNLFKFVPYGDEGTANTDQIHQNLKYLKLRFLGDKTDDAGVADLKELYTGIATASDEVAGWKAVCVALFLTPSFHVY